MRFEPCEPDFLAWWQHFLMMQAGVADPGDLFKASFYWHLSMQLQQKLGRLP